VAAAFLLELRKEKSLPQRIKDNSHHPREQFTAKFNPVKKVSYLRDVEWEFCRVSTKSFCPAFLWQMLGTRGPRSGDEARPSSFGDAAGLTVGALWHFARLLVADISGAQPRSI